MDPDRLRLLCVSPLQRPDPALVAACSRAGALGILDLGVHPDAARAALVAIRTARVPFGVRFPPDLEPFPVDDAALVVTSDPTYRHPRLLAEVTSADEAARAEAAGAWGLVAKGSESGGRIGEESAFVLLQRLVARTTLPVWLHGGVGLHTAGAALVGGARGVVLDAQLALMDECSLPEPVRTAIAAMDGSETTVVDGFRAYDRPGLPPDSPVRGLPIGQDAAFAASLARRFPRVGDLIRGLRRAIDAHRGQAAATHPLAPDAPFARQHGLRYPVVQGPMTRVSDVAGFAEAVADGGGLPFLALSLVRGEALEHLLSSTAKTLGNKPWGVGMLGFAPKDLRAEQIEAVRRAKPPVALLAGGRPAQARELEAEGIPTYLHVPSPGLLDLFLRDGARRFVFEGRECGGHVGPRTSFVLWEQCLERLLQHDAVHELSVVFAGGIHDARSASMVATLAAPLAVRGAKIAVLMGTAYLFTDEAVSTGAITRVFQDAALACDATRLVHTAPGHATRCADSAFVGAFEDTRTRLEAAGEPPDAVWEALERLNLGRLRIASKGLVRDGDALVEVDEDAQRRDGMFMIGQLAALRGETTTIAELHHDVSAGGDALLTVPARAEHAGIDIAIVGMAGVFPGAPDLSTFWSNIVLGRDLVTEVPKQRWDPAVYFDPNPADTTHTRSRWGGFIPTVPFEPLEFGIPPRSLAAIEPVQLLALQVAKRALEDAGFDRNPWDRERTSVVFGAGAGNDLASAYGFRALLPTYLSDVPEALDKALPRLTEDSFPGVLGNVIAGRIANRLDLGGLNYTVDAACASSLAALDVGCKELIAGTSDVVLVGGADLHNAIGDFLLFDSVHALSPSGRSRSFDAEADGIALGEGVAALVCKRLSDAERDGDRIYAVIKSIAGSSDGKSLGLTAPRREGQVLALERAYERAGVDPARVGLVEAHGTGTVVGDRTEIASLTEIYTAAGVGPGQVTLGSVKSNVGHTKCAAGLAGLVKVALALHHAVLPPTLHVRKPNPGWRPEVSPFVFRSRPAPWVDDDRHAAVSSFGFGGTNFHTVLAAHGEPSAAHALRDWPAEAFLFRDPADLAVLRDAIHCAPIPPRLADLARTVAERGAGPVKVAVVAEDLTDLRRLLTLAIDGGEDDNLFRADDAFQPGKVGWLFPGQGSQRPGMLGELFVAYPELQDLLTGDWADVLFPPDAFDPEVRKAQRAALTDTRVAQPALGIVELAAARVLARAGLQPDVVAGHSYGELVALCVAGSLATDELVALSRTRGERILAAAGDDPGTMAAITAAPAAIEPHLVGLDVVLANCNSPTQTVIAGSSAGMATASERLAAAGLEVRTFPVAAAFHSGVVAGAEKTLAEALAGFSVSPPRLPVFANTTALPYPTDPDAIRAQLARHVVRPVRFVEELEAMYAAGVRVFVEVGPGQVLTGFVAKTLGDRPHRALSLEDATGDGALVGMMRLLAGLATSGIPVDLDRLLAERGAVAVDLEALPGPSATAWWIDGQRAWPVQGDLPEHAMHLVSEPIRVGGGDGAREKLVAEYLRTLREQADAQRDVMLSFLGNAPAPRAAAIDVDEAPAKVSVVAAVAKDPGTLLLELVSERTGYPREMLDLDLDLEADLSIDSIKRVEILGVLAERLGENTSRADQEQLVEQLAGVRTLRGIVGWLESRTTAGAAEPKAAELPLDEPSTDGDGQTSRTLRFVPELMPLEAPAPGSFAGLLVEVVGTGPVAAAVEREVEAAGGRIGSPGQVLVVVTGASDEESGGERVYALADRVRRALTDGTARVRVVTFSGGRLGLGPTTSPHGVSGLIKTIAKEWPDRSVRRIDLDPEDPTDDSVRQLVAELLDDGGPTEVGYHAGERLGRRFAPCDLEAADALALDQDAVVLLTGGARGITASVARGLAERYRCTLVLVGRSPAPAPTEDPRYEGADTEAALRSRILASKEATTPAEVERRVRRLTGDRRMRETFAAIQASGARFEYHAADVRDGDAVRSVLDDVYARHGRIDVVLHGAGVNEDKLLRDKTRESFVRVFDTKVQGARNLVKSLRADTRAVVFFSSVAGAFGNRGQADYAAANDALDELAQGLTHGGARVLSIGWGPWGGGGMVTPELERQYQQRGVGVIDPVDGLDRLLDELAAGHHAQVVLMVAQPHQLA